MLSPVSQIPFRPSRHRIILLAGIAALLGSSAVQAADGTWAGTGTGPQAWSDIANWASGIIPGATTGTTNGDTAIFNSVTTGTQVTIDAGRIIKTITFGPSSGFFTLGNSTPNAGSALNLASGGNITLQMGYSAAGTATGNIIDAPLVLQPATSGTAGVYSFINNAVVGADTTATTSKLNIAGTITGGTTSSTITLTLGGTVGTRNAANAAGAATNANNISGIISDGGAAGGLGISVTGTTTGSAQIDAWTSLDSIPTAARPISIPPSFTSIASAISAMLVRSALAPMALSLSAATATSSIRVPLPPRIAPSPATGVASTTTAPVSSPSLARSPIRIASLSAATAPSPSMARSPGGRWSKRTATCSP